MIGATGQALDPQNPAAPGARAAGYEALLVEPLAAVEILGRSVLERTIERFQAAEVEQISVIVEAEASRTLPPFRHSFKNVTVEVVSDATAAITQQMDEFRERGIEHSFVHSAEAYVETDLIDFFYFHREARQPVTRAFDREGSLALWLVKCAHPHEPDLFGALRSARRRGSSYFIRGYVNRLAHPRDLRRLAADILRRRCETAPAGKEVRPGVWLDEGAEVHRRARIVAPAYIGCRTKIQDAAVITRFSSIERDCFVDCGTVVEDASILANTHIGIWLDVCHAVVRGHSLFSLGRNVVIDISDPSIIRSTNSVRRPGPLASSAEPVVAVYLAKAQPTPSAWQLGANLVEE